METWHPLIVHLPLVLLPLSAALDLAALARKEAGWHRLAFVLLWLGILSAAAAVLSGNSAADPYRQDPALRVPVEAHEDWATGVLLLFLALGLVRVPLEMQRRFAGPRFILWLLAALAGCVLVWVTGHSGGELVFRFGVGVHPKP